jgi:hypothetical protein
VLVRNGQTFQHAATGRAIEYKVPTPHVVSVLGPAAMATVLLLVRKQEWH